MNGRGFSSQAAYDAEKEDQWWWRQQRQHGLSRRDLMRFFAAGAGAAAMGVLPDLGGGTAQAQEAAAPAIIKPVPQNLFYIHGTNAETRFEAFKDTGYLTSNALFFVRNHSSTPVLDAKTWRLRIEGDGVKAPLELTYDELRAMPSRTVTKAIECAGNFRTQFEVLHGKPAPGTPWRGGAIGVAEWKGVSLSRVLARAGLSPKAVDFMPWGLDSKQVRRSLPISLGLEDDTLLVYEMNGKPLPPDHGYPVRLLTPGWVGVCNVKWVGKIEVSTSPLYSDWNTKTYVLLGPDYPTRPVVTTQNVKAAFELPWGGTLPRGRHTLTGRAWSGLGKIARVEVSFDGGASWKPASLDARNVPQAWVQFRIPWVATAGNHHLMARATDSRGTVQPLSIPFNEQGYLFGAIVKHPISVL